MTSLHKLEIAPVSRASGFFFGHDDVIMISDHEIFSTAGAYHPTSTTRLIN